MMRKTGMFICTNPSKFVSFIPQIQKGINTTLYIQFLHKNNLPLIGKKDASISLIQGPKFSSTMQLLYKNSVCLNLDVRVLLGGVGAKCPIYTISTKKSIDIVYFDVDLNKDVMESFIRNRIENCSSNCQPVALVDGGSESTAVDVVECEEEEQSNHVALGGTFDRLHTGHKMLLSEAALLTKKRLLIGLTDTEMLKTKILWELIQPYNERAENVRKFLEEVRPNLEVNVVPLNDVYGPTKDDRDLEVLIVSPETMKGGQKVNEMRQKNGLDPLKIRSIQLVTEDLKCWDVEEEKVSSSNGRLRLLGTLLKEPEKPNRPRIPYIIGLTGGIASGKTSVSRRLGKYGATVIDADKVAHTVYCKGEPGYDSVVKHFGEVILNPDTKEIDRRKLGSIIFADKHQRECLNSLLWPLILIKCESLIEKAATEGSRVVVIEASLLIEAQWNKSCHEIWTCFVPVPEAVKLVQERNQLSVEEATARVNSQLTNTERIEKANVVFSTLWPPEYTDLQVERAWKGLQTRLPACGS
uniref:Cytidyltransferase-like domain-containing protein n=1 Tax=Lygus hesperus TaxID=30085 RepID=A0A0K8TBU8_LYGHE